MHDDNELPSLRDSCQISAMRTTDCILIFTNILIQSANLIPLKSNENPAILSPSPRFGCLMESHIERV